MSKDGQYFDTIHLLLDTFEDIYKDLENGDALKNYYGHKIRFWRNKYPKKRKEKIIRRKCLRFILNRIARWMAYALDEIYKRDPTNDKFIKRVQLLHTKCYSATSSTDFGTGFTYLDVQTPAVSSDEEEKE